MFPVAEIASLDNNDGDPYDYCPATLNNIPFQRRLSNGTRVKFRSRGRSLKIADLGYSTDGHPLAEYELPTGDWIYSRDGKYRAYAGTIKVKCWHAHFMPIPGFFEVVIMGYTSWDYTGSVYANPTGISGGGEGGWGYYNSSNGFSNGDDVGWQNALSTYLSGGGCMAGWDIWVDGVQKCENGQPV